MKKKIWIGLAVILLFVLGWFMWGQRSNKEEAKYILGEVKIANVSKTIDATGNIEPVQKVDLGSKISGTIKKVYVKENEAVHAGQVLVEIEAKAAESSLAQNRSTLANKRSLYERYVQLYNQGAISYQELDDARTNYETAKAAYDKAQADINDTVIVSPMDGVVVGEPMNEGETISQGVANQMIIMTVADLSRMQIELAVDETDIGQVRRGQRVTFTVDAYSDKEFSGHVEDISRKRIGSGETVIYYTVYVDIDGDVSILYPSMTARAVIYATEAKNVPVIPITALRNDDKGQFVYKKNGDKLEKTYVKLGIIADTQAEVRSGLKEHDEIVVSGSVPEDKAGHEIKPRNFPR